MENQPIPIYTRLRGKYYTLTVNKTSEKEGESEFPLANHEEDGHSQVILA